MSSRWSRRGRAPLTTPKLCISKQRIDRPAPPLPPDPLAIFRLDYDLHGLTVFGAPFNQTGSTDMIYNSGSFEWESAALGPNSLPWIFGGWDSPSRTAFFEFQYGPDPITFDSAFGQTAFTNIPGMGPWDTGSLPIITNYCVWTGGLRGYNV